MFQDRIFLILLLLVSILGHHPSHASFGGTYGRLLRFLPEVKSKESSPAPSPGLDSDQKAETKSDQETGANREKCLNPAETCRDGQSLTVCRHRPKDDTKGSFLFFQNEGENPVKVKIVFLPSHLSREVPLQKQNTTVNVTADVGGCSSIVIYNGDWNCSIPMRVEVPKDYFFNRIRFATQVTPIHGVYVFFATAFIIVGVWACCKFGKSERQVDGIPYQELEMGQRDSTSANVVETADGWDESWDDDNWDEIREVKSPSQRQVGNRAATANGFSSRSPSRNGWEDNWDD